jgi:hypothetical protein
MESLGTRHGEGDERDVVQSFDADLVEYVVIAFPDLSAVAGIAAALGELVSGGRIRILDLVVVTTDEGRRPRVVQPGTAPELAPVEEVEGEVGGLLGEDDIALASEALPPWSTALVLVVEDLWAEHLAVAVRSSRGRIVGGERIPRGRLRGLGSRHERSEDAPGGFTTT